MKLIRFIKGFITFALHGFCLKQQHSIRHAIFELFYIFKSLKKSKLISDQEYVIALVHLKEIETGINFVQKLNKVDN